MSRCLGPFAGRCCDSSIIDALRRSAPSRGDKGSRRGRQTKAGQQQDTLKLLLVWVSMQHLHLVRGRVSRLEPHLSPDVCWDRPKKHLGGCEVIFLLTRIDLGEEKTDVATASRQSCQQKQQVFNQDDVFNPAPAASILFTPSFNVFSVAV